jgi:3-dehydroquinate synthase
VPRVTTRHSLLIRSASGAYLVHSEAGSLDRLGRLMKSAGLGRRAVVVSDATVAALYSGRALAALGRAGCDAALVTIPPGERSKTLRTAGRVYAHLAALAADRDTAVVALGGGVVGDLAGFVAATYLRGLPLVQVPTTLLAQADSAAGGKTGVDLPEGKNLVGAFHAPRLVVIDPQTLDTLPARQLRSGLAEVVKVGMALDARLFRHLERHAEAVLALHPGPLGEALWAALRAKARLVQADERDRGRRQLLNYGHTVGHALEAAGRYRRWLHGEAVALGMRAAARVSLQARVLDAASEARQTALLARLGLARSWPRVPIRSLLPYLDLDKKRGGGGRAFVLTGGVGVATVRRDLSREALVRALRSLGAEP